MSLEAVLSEQANAASTDAGNRLVHEVLIKQISTHAGHAILSATEIRVVERIERFQSKLNGLLFQALHRNLELSLYGHGPILAARIVERVAAKLAVLSLNEQITEIVGSSRDSRIQVAIGRASVRAETDSYSASRVSEAGVIKRYGWVSQGGSIIPR